MGTKRDYFLSGRFSTTFVRNIITFLFKCKLTETSGNCISGPKLAPRVLKPSKHPLESIFPELAPEQNRNPASGWAVMQCFFGVDKSGPFAGAGF
jgi:hypothetical protein